MRSPAGVVEHGYAAGVALVERFEKLENGARRKHAPVHCGYRAFSEGGERLLQLDTYGSPERQIQGKTSQTLQLNAQSAKQLMSILREAFPGLN